MSIHWSKHLLECTWKKNEHLTPLILFKFHFKIRNNKKKLIFKLFILTTNLTTENFENNCIFMPSIITKYFRVSMRMHTKVKGIV